ncbi:MAG: hypothetical protein JXI43_05140 [Tissierellales bacterium]|nr:hypothetical protein [Tissierellales bacterium]
MNGKKIRKTVISFLLSILASLIAGIILGRIAAIQEIRDELKETIIIHGHLKNINNFAPMENILVEAISYPNTNTRTNSEGYFALELDNVEEKVVYVVFYKIETNSKIEIHRIPVIIPQMKNIIKLNEIYYGQSSRLY